MKNPGHDDNQKIQGEVLSAGPGKFFPSDKKRKLSEENFRKQNFFAEVARLSQKKKQRTAHPDLLTQIQQNDLPTDTSIPATPPFSRNFKDEPFSSQKRPAIPAVPDCPAGRVEGISY